jgi:hypothetical protein
VPRNATVSADSGESPPSVAAATWSAANAALVAADAASTHATAVRVRSYRGQ